MASLTIKNNTCAAFSNSLESNDSRVYFIEKCKDIILYKNRTLFSLIDDNNGKEIYVNEAIITNQGIKLKLNIGYALFNKGSYVYKALVSTFTIIESYNSAGHPIKVSLSNQAKIDVLERICDSKIIQLHTDIEVKSKT